MVGSDPAVAHLPLTCPLGLSLPCMLGSEEHSVGHTRVTGLPQPEGEEKWDASHACDVRCYIASATLKKVKRNGTNSNNVFYLTVI